MAKVTKKKTLARRKKLELYEALLLPRMIEERMLTLLRQGKISKWFSGIGQEAIAVGATCALQDDDVILPMHRNLGVFTSRKIPLKKLFRQLMGKEGGFTKGRDRTFHFGTLEYNIVGMISHLAAMLPVADGFGLAFQLKKEKRIALAFTGDGATSEGDFHEALNLAAVWNLPVIFLIENNGYGLSTPTHEQFICKRLADRALGYGIEGVQIDGNDVLEVYRAIENAAKKARAGKGPTLIEAMTFRMRGHEEASGTKYVPAELFEVWQKRDPVQQFETHLLKNDELDDQQKNSIEQKLRQEIELALDDALAAPLPVSTIERELADVYAPAAVKATTPEGPRSEKRYIDAVSDALRQKMEADEQVLIMGQDIAEYGGVFKITQDFIQKFGHERVRNTPIIESAAIGAAMGLALQGLKPVVEMQFADFVSCGFNQIVNNLAKTHYRWGEPINVTLRLPAGGSIGAGPYHSQNNEAWFYHVPGLKLIAPSTPFDAKGLLAAAMDDPNPVLMFEHKALYRSQKQEIPDAAYSLEIGKADIKRPGRDLTIVTYGICVHWALELAEQFAKDGTEIEVVDLRTLLPWDLELILTSLQKTSRLLILHEANLTGGIGAEIAATVAQQGFELLDAPIRRVASIDTPIPFSEQLEKQLYLPRERLVDAVREVLAF